MISGLTASYRPQAALLLALATGLGLPEAAQAAAGEIQVPAFTVSTAAPRNGRDQDPAIAGHSSGQFAIAWARYNGGPRDAADFDGGIHVRRFAADGRPLGAETFIARALGLTPDIALIADGRSIVAWQNLEGSPSIRAQRIAADGRLDGPEIIVEPGLQACSGNSPPKLAAEDDGSFVVTWQQCPEATYKLPGSDFGFVPLLSTAATHQRRHAADGTPVGRDTVVAFAAVPADCCARPFGAPSVSNRNQGAYALSWLDRKNQPVVRFYDAMGREQNTGLARLPSLAAGVGGFAPFVSGLAPVGLGSDGQALTVFSVDTSVNGIRSSDLLLQRYAPSGTEADPLPLASDGQDNQQPALDTLGSGRSVAVWRSVDNRNGVFGVPPPVALRGRLIAPNGLPEAPAFTFSTVTDTTPPVAAFAGASRVATTWTELRSEAPDQPAREVLRALVLSAE